MASRVVRPKHTPQRPAAQLAKCLEDRRKPELLDRHQFRRNAMEHAAEAVDLLEEIAAEARPFIHLVGEVEVA